MNRKEDMKLQCFKCTESMGSLKNTSENLSDEHSKWNKKGIPYPYNLM